MAVESGIESMINHNSGSGTIKRCPVCSTKLEYGETDYNEHLFCPKKSCRILLLPSKAKLILEV